MEIKVKRIVFIIAILILILINVVIYIKYTSKSMYDETYEIPVDYNELEEENINQTISDTVETKISNMDEISRARTYFGEFVDAIESENYELAYSYLNQTYKANYFPTLDEFSEYIKNKYPSNDIIVEYESVEKKGEIFVLEVIINDDEDTEFQEFSQSIVIRENSVNNFSISFSKDE